MYIYVCYVCILCMYLCTFVCRYTFIDMDMQCECVYSLVQHTQIEAKTYNVVQGEGIVAESKRSHLKRERKLPEKLRSIQMVDDDFKTYKRGLFEKRVAELVSPFTASRMPIIYTHKHIHIHTHIHTQTHTHDVTGSLQAASRAPQCVSGQDELILRASFGRLGQRAATCSQARGTA